MKAVIWTKYGSPEVLQLKETVKPKPKKNEVLIKIYATTAYAGDCEMRSLKFSFWLRLLMRLFIGVRKPKRVTVLGQELAGEVETVGKDVKRFKKGDKIFGATGFGFGAYAEYICMPEKSLEEVVAIKPANMTYKEAATVPVGGLNALYFLRKGNIQRGQKILINGAAGSIGTIAIQLAKYFGAEVTAVDSTKKLDMLRSIGADHVIDYTQENFSKMSGKYDVIFDVVSKGSFSSGIKSLNKKGIYLLANSSISRSIRGLLISITSSKKVIGGTVTYKTEDLIFLKELIEAGNIKSVIDRLYPLAQITKAHRYVDNGQKIGNVVITVAHDH
ncbi:NAD(P)-dependent alcohol dehydrogenase [Promethearchaeum syntrophicum]|uniref:NAD(P)-dependent alcohol dehydrogenase n=1 Tax=Promethearchaeum syntrophicum TaxID=2594042 RepID=A0A5B9D6D3_9ARCH|nr:NAD(P)-dependent alcohol dehydrogenase [Candidatus Prometheoarchaeum syntrophicum]QEE14592.1 NAD-dependent alcohol dehydrogenase [Candidatus Prometheoarchaeum syntrophicum]